MVVIDTTMRGPVQDQQEQLLNATLDRMVGMADSARCRDSRGAHGRQIAIAGITVMLNRAAASFEHQLERLAWAVEASIAHERASAMLAAAGGTTGPIPLWLVTGSGVFSQWLAWSRGDMALRRVLRLSDQADIAPIAGVLNRSARIALGQTPAKIRVANGLAVAEKIELPAPQRCIMHLGQTARVAISACQLPETVIASLAGRSMSELVSHPFFSAANIIIKAARNEEERTLVVDLAHDWRPLAPVPEVALTVVPADADPACPWRPTRREIADLYALVDALRGHERQV